MRAPPDDPLGRGPWWRLTSFVVVDLFALCAWVYFFVLNRTRIVRPYRGAEHANLMFVANHQSPVDTALIAVAALFPRILFRPRLHPWSAAAARYWFRHRVIAWLASRLRCLPARTGRRDGETVRALCRVQPRGLTVFFPEGKRSPDGTIGPGKAGAGFVALQTGARIVPVAINGLLEAMPYRRPWPRIGKKLVIAFGDPVSYDDLTAHPATRVTAQELVDRSLAAVKGLHRVLAAPPPHTARWSRTLRKTFAGKVVWITGASSGIGRALAIALHEHSATLILSSRDRVALEAVAAECAGDGRVHVLPFDLTDEAAVPDAVRTALLFEGHVDCVVHNAGLAARATAAETNTGVHRRIMETNYFGPVALTKAILPSMVRRKRGTFVVVSSVVGRFGVPRMGAYSASKHALHGYFESLRSEVRADNIHVSIAVPGFVDTAITVNALTGTGEKYGRQMRVHLDGMSPEECAQRILRGVAAGRREFLIGGVETLGVPLLRVSRRLVAFLVRNHPFLVRERIRSALSRGTLRLTTRERSPDGIPVSW